MTPKRKRFISKHPKIKGWFCFNIKARSDRVERIEKFKKYCEGLAFRSFDNKFLPEDYKEKIVWVDENTEMKGNDWDKLKKIYQERPIKPSPRLYCRCFIPKLENPK